MKPIRIETSGRRSINPGRSPVGIYNPLHKVLEHFADRLAESLEVSGITSVRLRSLNGEVGDDLRAKAFALGAHVKNARHHVRAGGPNVVTWPLLGWWEMPLWRHNAHKTLVVMHDPEALVRQNGLSPSSAAASARISGAKWPHLVTMSPEAYALTARYFNAERVHLVPHPMTAPVTDNSTRAGRKVLVLGQHKPARDLDVMASIATPLRAAGWEPTVAGRGWPLIPGWNVVDRFLAEQEFHELICSSAVVLLPYRYYFQSGVALRALEAGVPVVGRQTGFLTSIFGTGFPGAVDDWGQPAAWLAAITAADSARGDQIQAAADYAARGTAEWAALLG